MAGTRVLVVGLGGTIAVSGPGGVPDLTAEQLVGSVRGLAECGVVVDALNLRNLPGASLTLADLAELMDVVGRELAGGAAGVVVMQGTDTIEETAYVLDLVHAGPQPIVVTGAMRNPALAGADGPANILAAVRVAGSPVACDLGCLVVMADEIHAAARVRKTHASSVAAFASPNGGPLGYLSEGAVRILHRPVRRSTARGGLPAGAAVPRVGLYVATLGDDGDLLPGLVERLDGLVVAGFGVGHVPETWVVRLHEAVRRIPVVLASRTGSGFVGTETYGFPGSETDLAARGLVSAGALDAYKARLVLQMVLLHGGGPDEVAAAFAGGRPA